MIWSDISIIRIVFPSEDFRSSDWTINENKPPWQPRSHLLNTERQMWKCLTSKMLRPVRQMGSPYVRNSVCPHSHLHPGLCICVFVYLCMCVFVYICMCLTWGHFMPAIVYLYALPSHFKPGLSEYFGKSHNWRNSSTKLSPQEKYFTFWKMFYDTWTFISSKWQQNIFFCINIFYGTEIALIKVVVKVPVQCYILSIPM